MEKTAVTGFFKTIQTNVSKYSPQILTGVGVLGMIGTTIMAVKATPKALELIDAKKKESETEKLPPIEVVKTTWKCYAPAVVTGAASVTCLVRANSINTRRNAALMTAYNLSKTALTEYKDKVIETIGEKKEQVIRDNIAKDKMEKDPVTNREVVITEKGNTLCYDALFGRYFMSDIDAIKRAVNNINRDIVNNMYASLNSFYDELGLSRVDIGDELGWNFDDRQIDIYFTSQLAENGMPCLVMNYSVAPKYDYSKFA